MAKSITVTTIDGEVHTYQSTLVKGYHLHQGSNGFCITEKSLFGKEQTVACYLQDSVQSADQERCVPCEMINPTQQSSNKNKALQE